MQEVVTEKHSRNERLNAIWRLIDRISQTQPMTSRSSVKADNGEELDDFVGLLEEWRKEGGEYVNSC